MPLFGIDFAFPGYLIVAALAYAGIGTLVAHTIGWRLIGLQFNQQRYESDFRFAIARVTDNAEPVALMGGEPVERAELAPALRRAGAQLDRAGGAPDPPHRRSSRATGTSRPCSRSCW